MTFFYDLVGAHTPKQRLIVQLVFFVVSLYCLVDELLHNGTYFMVIWWGITCALSVWTVVDEYYNMKFSQMKVI